ncbi:MAG: hypothetical protein ACTSRA_21605, partial [Promethearchaeota archaeon]
MSLEKRRFWLIEKIKEYNQNQKKRRQERLKLWGDIGYHRYLGGENYNKVLFLFIAPASLLLFSVIAELFFPDPSVKGYQDLTQSLLGFFFGVMDIGLAGGQGYMSGNMTRFISENAEIRPMKALKQIQFFVVWQMFTGLIQVTAVGIYCFTALVHTTLAHMALFILAYSFIQYPGILQMFESLFQCFQRYDMHGVVTNIRDAVFSPIAQVSCVLVGKFWGMMDPRIGEVVGITIGFLVSIYVADIFGIIFGGKLFTKSVIKQYNYNFRIRDFFKMQFKWVDIKEILYFIGPIQFIKIALGILGLITTIWITQWVNSYASWKGLLAFAGMVAGIAMPGGTNKSLATVSEAYNNGKIYLTHDYIEKIFKYHGIRSTTNFLPVMILLPLVLDRAIDLLDLGNLAQYTAGIVAVPLYIFMLSTNNLFNVPSQLLVIATKRNVIIAFDVISPVINFFFAWLLLVNLRLGWVAIPLYSFIPNAILSIIKYIYVFRKILPGFKFTGWWQSIFAPSISAFGIGGFGLLVYWISKSSFAFVEARMPGSSLENTMVWIFITLLAFLIFIIHPIIYQVFYSLVGGWDDDSLEEYRKGVLLSGPSSWMVKPTFWVARFFSKISPLHGRFPIKFQSEVKREINELMALRAT